MGPRLRLAAAVLLAAAALTTTAAASAATARAPGAPPLPTTHRQATVPGGGRLPAPRCWTRRDAGGNRRCCREARRCPCLPGRRCEPPALCERVTCRPLPGGGGGGGRTPPPSPSPSPTPWALGTALSRCTAATRRTRKEVRDLTAAERTRFTDAVAALLASGVYATFVPPHAASAAGAHGGPAFFPWHRLFLLEFEDALRAVDPRVTLPYWDWSIDAAAPARSPVWGPTLLGGATPGGCIPSGPFAGARAVFRTPHCVRRGFTSAAPGRAASMDGLTFDEPPVLDALIRGRTSYAAFTQAIEFSHGAPHVAIGGAQLRSNEGDMFFVSTSPNDPAFFLHHAFIDYLWARRQSAAGRSASEYGGTNPGGRPARSTDRLSPFGRATVADTFSLPCVTYAAPAAGAIPLASASPERRSRAGTRRARAAVNARRVRREAAQAVFARDSGVGAADAERARRTVAAASDAAVSAATLLG